MELVTGLPPVRIWPIYKEDYGAQYGKKRLSISYKGKTVLDVGADVGSTADFFLRRGAKRVFAVEGNPNQFRQLKQNAAKIPGITPIHLYIQTPKHFEHLIGTYSSDVLKADCEGCEVHLFNVRDCVFRLVPEYLVETHNDSIFDMMVSKCKRCGYTIVDVNEWCKHVRIVYALKP